MLLEPFVIVFEINRVELTQRFNILRACNLLQVKFVSNICEKKKPISILI